MNIPASIHLSDKNTANLVSGEATHESDVISFLNLAVLTIRLPQAPT